jgi:Fe-Mn family superoxide dismutase
MSFNRRQFIWFLGTTTTTALIWNKFPQSAIAQGEEGPFEVLPLPYDYDALEPYIDAETMKFHHDKHYAGYTQKLNMAVNKYPELKTQDAETLLRNLKTLPPDIQTTVRNNGGGYVNHTMFWEIMSPNGGGEPTGKIADAINQSFGSFEKFQEQFNEAGANQFGSGWAWLVLDQNKTLKVISTPNQDSPLLQGMYPIMGNDVWEHAYYLKYKNNRGEYLSQWWNVVNWDQINQRLEKAIP